MDKHFTLTIGSLTFFTLTNRIEADLDKIFFNLLFFLQKILLRISFISILIKNRKTKPKQCLKTWSESVSILLVKVKYVLLPIVSVNFHYLYGISFIVNVSDFLLALFGLFLKIFARISLYYVFYCILSDIFINS